MPVVKDLVPDLSTFYEQHKSIRPWLELSDADAKNRTAEVPPPSLFYRPSPFSFLLTTLLLPARALYVPLMSFLLFPLSVFPFPPKRVHNLKFQNADTTVQGRPQAPRRTL